MAYKFNPFTGKFDITSTTTTTSTDASSYVENVTCDSSVAVGDVVILSGGSFVRAQADSFTNGNFIGVAYAKPTSTTCHVRFNGLTDGVFVGLTPNTNYFLSEATPGAITTTPPSGDQNSVVIVGQAYSTTQLIVRKQLVVIRETA